MTMQLTPERITELLIEFAVTKLQAGVAPGVVEQELIRQGAQTEVAKLLVSKALDSLKPI
ncbi:MAG: hypothetical protein H7837_10090 [Magnetococcus sp. MYC-9]